MLGLHALGVTHNDYHYGNLLVADEATGELKVIDLESLRKILRARRPTAPCREDGTPGPHVAAPWTTLTTTSVASPVIAAYVLYSVVL
ncbi:unnamed protein product [Vitrella brassicaformis CCMP3155]|uniref:Protein kinase domain-containing protein n=1 Tax=Vitrella brassicaformis (strain CCMP3155) TaxID=1169540 RepID=A0A0G4FZD0_VITBC|nr:unnamed protein product [Vitrella brassicaformis CCMP3155]|eukprot:CEM20979.1 unnamed protein product [Vitrella brassicaformis CCMP3155]